MKLQGEMKWRVISWAGLLGLLFRKIRRPKDSMMRSGIIWLCILLQQRNNLLVSPGKTFVKPAGYMPSCTSRPAGMLHASR